MNNPIWRSFLEQQYAASVELAAHSDVMTIHPLANAIGPPTRYIARYRCTSILRGADGQIGPAESECAVGITLAEDHLRYVDPLRVVTWLGPSNIVQPNLRPPFACVGHVFPGIELVDLLYSVYEMICYFNWASDDALNEEAAAWARRHQHLFPVERRTLRRRTRLCESDRKGGGQ